MIRHTRTLLAIAAGTTALALAAPRATYSEGAKDRAAVERAVLDYVEGVYEAKPELIERSVHPGLAKYGFWRDSGDKAYTGMAMTRTELEALARTWNADGSHADEESPKKVEILDMLDQMAAVKLTAAWGIDYMHLAKYDGKWQISQVLWQSHPE